MCVFELRPLSKRRKREMENRSKFMFGLTLVFSFFQTMVSGVVLWPQCFTTLTKIENLKLKMLLLLHVPPLSTNLINNSKSYTMCIIMICCCFCHPQNKILSCIMNDDGRLLFVLAYLRSRVLPTHSPL